MIRFIAWLLAPFYRGGLFISQKSYTSFPFRIRKVKAHVISVGNITWGGTGKTPLVIRLARLLTSRGKKVAVLTRGYGKDEVAELKNKLMNVAVLVGRDRIQMAKQAIEKYKAEILILDDGFQHIRLHRDIDVVTINATSPFGPGGLIPLGTLREPAHHLKRADIFILTKSDIALGSLKEIRKKILSIKPNAVIFEAIHKPSELIDIHKRKSVTLSELKGKKIATLSGVGDPSSFEKMVEREGAQVLFSGRFEDHHVYTELEMIDFTKKCDEVGVKIIVTTEKDFYRLNDVLRGKQADTFLLFQFWVLQIDFQLNDEEDFVLRCLKA